jgi:hypothetical protein
MNLYLRSAELPVDRFHSPLSRIVGIDWRIAVELLNMEVVMEGDVNAIVMSYTDFLRNKRLVSEKHVNFDGKWLSDYIYFVRKNGITSRNESVLRFVAFLEKRDGRFGRLKPLFRSIIPRI